VAVWVSRDRVGGVGCGGAVVDPGDELLDAASTLHRRLLPPLERPLLPMSGRLKSITI
jgi:hypothetical protein